jgi:hypothetical protein
MVSARQAAFARRTAETAFWHWPRSTLRHSRLATSSQSVRSSPIGYSTSGDAALPDGVVGTPYSYQFLVDEGCKPYEFVAQNSSLPPGLAFDSNTQGLLTGTPTAAGSFFFWVEVRDTGCRSSANTWGRYRRR